MLSWAAVATGSLPDTHKKQYSVCNRHVTLAVTMTCLLQNLYCFLCVSGREPAATAAQLSNPPTNLATGFRGRTVLGSDGRKLPSKQAQTAEEDGKADWTEEKADCS